MANKAVPQTINGVNLHEKAQQRTNKLLEELEQCPFVRIGSLSSTKSGIDRLRLIASAIFTLVDELAESPEQVVSTSVAKVADSLR